MKYILNSKKFWLFAILFYFLAGGGTFAALNNNIFKNLTHSQEASQTHVASADTHLLGATTVRPADQPFEVTSPTPVVTQNKKTFVDPDPIITCNYTHAAPMQMKKSECAQSTDCQIGIPWYAYKSRDKCHEDQAKYSADHNYVPVNNYVYTPSIYTAPQITTPVTFDCTVAGQIVGNMTSEQCITAINNYYNNLPQKETINHQDLRNQCRRQMSANGIGDSSFAAQCESL